MVAHKPNSKRRRHFWASLIAGALSGPWALRRKERSREGGLLLLVFSFSSSAAAVQICIEISSLFSPPLCFPAFFFRRISLQQKLHSKTRRRKRESRFPSNIHKKREREMSLAFASLQGREGRASFYFFLPTLLFPSVGSTDRSGNRIRFDSIPCGNNNNRGSDQKRDIPVFFRPMTTVSFAVAVFGLGAFHFPPPLGCTQ